MGLKRVALVLGEGLAGLGGLATAVAESFQFFVFDGKTYGPSQIDVAAVTPAGPVQRFSGRGFMSLATHRARAGTGL